MAHATAWLYRNLKRAELALGIAAIAALIGLFLQRMVAVERIAERAGFEVAIGDMHNRTRMVNVLLLANGGIAAIDALAGTNPVVLLAPAESPDGVSGYLGEIDRVTPENLKKGGFAFDISTGEFTYHAVHPESFGLPDTAAGLLRYRLVSEPAELGLGVASGSGSTSTRVLRLRRVTESWPDDAREE